MSHCALIFLYRTLTQKTSLTFLALDSLELGVSAWNIFDAWLHVTIYLCEM